MIQEGYERTINPEIVLDGLDVELRWAFVAPLWFPGVLRVHGLGIALLARA